MANLRVEWQDGGRTAQHPPDPAYPDGKPIDVSNGAVATCSIELPYPAPRCGVWAVVCPDCGLSIGFTAAGRIDDPRRVTVACKLGATGDFPHGKLSNDDEGGINVALSGHLAPDGTPMVRLNFGQPVAWLSLPRDQAIQFAMAILKHAGLRGMIVIGEGGDDAEDSRRRGQGDQEV
jgi:hypothetical protein